MRAPRLRLLLAFITSITALAPACAGRPGPVDVLSGRNDDGRTGANLREQILTPAAVRRGFGKLFTYSVDGFVYAQPLVVTGLATSTGVRNVLIVATTTNHLYAFDADSNAVNDGKIWHEDLTPAGATLTEAAGSEMAHLAPSVGILSTPVIDRTTGTLYVVSRWFDPSAGASGRHVQQLHARSLSTGEVAKPPVTIAAEVNGRAFDPTVQQNRPGLALVNGLVIVAWNSFLDISNATGWVMAYDAATLDQKGVFCAACYAGWGGNIWQSGRPPAVDPQGRHVYFFTGNGAWRGPGLTGARSCDPTADPAKPAGYFGESLIKLDTSRPDLWKQNQAVASWTPYDWCELEQHDTDFGGSGPMLIPGVAAASPWWGDNGPQSGPTTIAIGGGKAGVLYAIDTNRITGTNLVEWTPLPAPNQGRAVSAINECVDFDNLADTISPPDGTGVDVPAQWPYLPTNVGTGPHIGGEHGPGGLGETRPLCAQLNLKPIFGDQLPNYGNKSDGLSHHIMAGPVFWPTTWLVDWSLPVGQPGTGLLYVAPENLPVVAYEMREGHIKRVRIHGQASEDGCLRPSIAGHPGGLLTLSADGDRPDTGIVWTSHYRDVSRGNATFGIQDGVLEAFDAASLRLLWSSASVPGDRVGPFAKFTPPTVANGKVYLATSPSPSQTPCADPGKCPPYSTAGSDGGIAVYGLNSRAMPACFADLGPFQRPWYDFRRNPGPLAILFTVVIAVTVMTTLAVVGLTNRFRR